jgi:hypothetical protein
MFAIDRNEVHSVLLDRRENKLAAAYERLLICKRDPLNAFRRLEGIVESRKAAHRNERNVAPVKAVGEDLFPLQTSDVLRKRRNVAVQTSYRIGMKFVGKGRKRLSASSADEGRKPKLPL